MPKKISYELSEQHSCSTLHWQTNKICLHKKMQTLYMISFYQKTFNQNNLIFRNLIYLNWEIGILYQKTFFIPLLIKLAMHCTIINVCIWCENQADSFVLPYFIFFDNVQHKVHEWILIIHRTTTGQPHPSQ